MALEIVPGTTENTYSILTPSGKYLSASAAKKFNLSETYSADNCDFAISFGEKNAIVIKQASSTNRQIRYNHNNGKGGFRWYDGTTADAVYLYKGPSVNKYSVSYGTVEGGSFSASPSKAEAGAEITLTATPAEGYAFNNDWSVKGADETVIEVVDGKFIMPAQNVSVSGTFSKVAYTITKAAAENGSFTVKNGTAEVTTAFKGDKLTLEATPAEGFTFGKWTVTYMDGETEKSFNPSANTFNMPGANVTVSATFVEAAVVPVYASVAELIAAGKPTKDATKVTVTLTDEEIIRFHTLKDGTVAGAIIKVGTQEVEIFCKGTPSNWEIGGTISGTLTNCDWMLFYSTWELCPTDYSELTYKAPMSTCATPVITIAEGGVVSITCETTGATIHYTVGDAPADPTEADAVFSAVTLTEGQTIKVIAVAEGFKPSAVASKKYSIIEEKDFSKTYSLGLEGWSLTEYSTKNGYYLVPSGNNPSVATIPSIFVGKTIKSDIVISLNVATYGGGTNPSTSTFSIFNSSDCKNSVSATQSGKLPTSSTYTDVVYTVKASDAVSLTSDLAIKITKPGKQIRLKTIKVEFKYSE